MSKKPGLYANIHAKRARGEKMRKPGEEGAPSAQDFKNAAKTAKKKKGVKRQDPKGNPAGYYDKEGCKMCKGGKKPCRCGKADMGRKGPYADGCGYNKDAVAEEFNGILINDAERSDKPCGNSYIPQNAKCSKGAGQPAKKGGANSPEKWGGESVNAKGGYAKFLKKKGIDPSKLGANSPKAEKLAQEYYKTPEGKAEFKRRSDAERADKPCGNSHIPQNAKCTKGAGQAKKSQAEQGEPRFSDRQRQQAVRKVAAARFKAVKRGQLKKAIAAYEANPSEEPEKKIVNKAAKRELFNRNVRNVAAAGLYGTWMTTMMLNDPAAPKPSLGGIAKGAKSGVSGAINKAGSRARRWNTNRRNRASLERAFRKPSARRPK